MGRRLRQRAVAQALLLRLAQGRGREARAVGEPRDRADVHAALEPQHAEQHGARRVLAHQESRRRLAAQRVIGDARDGGAVARAGEAVREAPILERVRRRTASRLDIGHHLDGGGEACGGCHRDQRPITMWMPKMTHMTQSTTALAMNTMPRRGMLLSVTWIHAWITRNTTKTQASSTNSRSAVLVIQARMVRT